MILILEDNPEVAAMMEMIFSHVFHDECRVTHKIKDALMCACCEDVKLIMSDLDLGGGECALTFLRRIRHLKPHSLPPIVVFTGLDPDEPDYREAARLSDSIYQKGTFSAGEICRTLHDLLTSHAAVSSAA